MLIALKDVELALSGLAAVLKRGDAPQAARSRNSRALGISGERFRPSAIGFLNLLDAQRTLIAADEVHLFDALGGGWRQEPVGA